MDEEIEKPFPIELFVILLIVAIANDIAEIFFDLLDFTGVGVAGEAIMEPANFILDLFFTGIFWWKVGPGGSTITQYIGDLLEPLLIPGRTLSVFAGMYLANNPHSAIGKIAMTAAVGVATGGAGIAVEGVEAGAVAAESAEATAAAAQGAATTGAAAEGAGVAAGGAGGAAVEAGAQGAEAAEGAGQAKEGIDLEPKEEKNPLENLGEELDQPAEEEFHEGEGLKKAIDFASQTDRSQDEGEEEGDEDLPMAA